VHKKLRERVKQQRLQIRRHDEKLKAKLDKMYDVSLLLRDTMISARTN
jgi:hypothetical protein